MMCHLSHTDWGADMYLFSLGSESPKGAIGHIVPTDKTILAVETNKMLLPPHWSRTFSWGFDDFSCCLGNYGSDKVSEARAQGGPRASASILQRQRWSGDGHTQSSHSHLCLSSSTWLFPSLGPRGFWRLCQGACGPCLPPCCQ